MPLFGGYWGYMEAPFQVVKRHELAWMAKNAAENELKERQKRELENRQRNEMNNGW
jgi:hypothetical protein